MKMKNIKNIIKLMMVIMIFAFINGGLSTKATESAIDREMQPLVTSNGSYVYYAGTNDNVMIPTEYEHDAYLRSVWVTPLAGCIPSYSNAEQYKKEILEVFDVMEYYNLNALIFHIRIMNDALYKSSLNPTSGYLNADWDVLEWIITECHKRGFEFHAWLNPYRVKASGGSDAVTEAAKIKAKCPNNIGSDPENLLVNSSGGVILNPGIEAVRKFIVDTCMEVIVKYDVDAIHFDDYFYISNVDDSKTYNANNPNGLELADWRREQVNLFIELLHDTVEVFNKANNRYVQIGISPTGIYRNGDGVVTYDENGNAISSGSKTGGQEHYASYLFSDTVKWINEEWIDYIMPQSYWAFTHKIAGYADVMSWWDKIVEYKNVNLYSGMGIYMSETPGSNYSWGYDPYESCNQILYASTLKNCDGTVFYNYTYLEKSYKGQTGNLYNTGLAKVKKDLFNNKCVLPVLKSFDPVELAAPKNISYLKDGKNVNISFDRVDDAKMYVIYRSEKNITFDEDEVYDIIYADSSLDRITYVDESASKEYNYAVRTQSKTNHLSKDAAYANFIEFTVTYKNADGSVLKQEVVNFGGSVTPPSYSGNDFVGWSKDTSYVTSDMEVTPRFKNDDFYVNFYNDNNELVKTLTTKYKGTVTAPEIEKEGFVLVGWDKDFSEVVYDLDVYPIYEEKVCSVKFVDWDGTELLTLEVKYGHDGYYPEDPERRSYRFTGWDASVEGVKDDMIINPIYEAIMCKVTFVNGVDNSVIAVKEVLMYDNVEAPEAPEVPGYEFYKWIGNMNNVVCDMTVKAEYSEKCYEIKFVDSIGNEIETIYYFYGDKLEYPTYETPSGYEFTGWDRDLNNIITDLVITAVLKKLEIKVTFVDFNGEVIAEVVYKDGEEREYPESKKIKGYKFVEWDTDLDTLIDDAVVTGVYEKTSEKSSCNKGSILIELFFTISLMGFATIIFKKK